jgi:hypothetical protein
MHGNGLFSNGNWDAAPTVQSHPLETRRPLRCHNNSSHGSLPPGLSIDLNHPHDVERIIGVAHFKVDEDTPCASVRVSFDHLIDRRDVVNPRSANRDPVVAIACAALPQSIGRLPWADHCVQATL